jgi:hypothetical protein
MKYIEYTIYEKSSGKQNSVSQDTDKLISKEEMVDEFIENHNYKNKYNNEYIKYHYYICENKVIYGYCPYNNERYSVYAFVVDYKFFYIFELNKDKILYEMNNADKIWEVSKIMGELCIIRKNYLHGHISAGWMGKNKIILSQIPGFYDLKYPEKTAEEFCNVLNNLEKE